MFECNVYPYGSYVYGTATENSDEDAIVVCDKFSKEEIANIFDELDVTCYTTNEFQKLLNEHELSVLEAFFFPQIQKPVLNFTFELDVFKLRSSCAAKASNSWVKAKKKLDEQSPDYSPYIGKKSAWHAIRILDFACQIIENGGIINYASCNRYYNDILNCGSWEEIEMKYRLVYNQYRSKLRLLAPKEVYA